ncbi:CD2 antigen cytoplasmic tail-binding protein 2 homolog [Haliotis rubra]|uniref:CD2 antigen cytoplasmic tail-binding protein 2 homolog n=1 Tax=Haliotis rubra TaxID=36100 RepID=UPI001EE5EF5E|nr:CD2 antigen cytoplasmic tail-binding protein 2 homolog [Haliotis rubra]
MSEFQGDMFSEMEETRPKEQPKETRFKEKHSLDSDEEDDDGDKHEVLDDEEIEGQEEGISDVVEGIQITPFNMTEEMEEGHFDKDGMFIFEKDKAQIRDSWMDNIDWVKVKETQIKHDLKRSLSDSDEELPPFNEQAVYAEILPMLQPGESIAKALRRIGGNQNLSASQRLKLKKQKKLGNVNNSNTEEEAQEKKAKMAKLTELADSFVSNGIMDIYEMTYEKISHTLKKMESQKVKFDVPADVDDDDALDMFADNFDKKESDGTEIGPRESKKAKLDLNGSGEDASHKTEPAAASTSTEAASSSAAASTSAEESEVKWEYKWEDTDSATIHGPFNSTQMLKWSDDGFFKNGAYCRKVGAANAQFYNTRRIDFDLYT